MVQDRFFGYLNGDFTTNLPAGKKAAIVVTCGSGLDGAQATEAQIEGMAANFFKMNVVGKIVKGNMMAPNAASDDAAIMAEAKAIGAKL